MATLATILNCLGIALNYRHDSRLRDKSILKPRWLVDGIYTVLRWMQKHKTNGVVKLADFGLLTSIMIKAIRIRIPTTISGHAISPPTIPRESMAIRPACGAGS